MNWEKSLGTVFAALMCLSANAYKPPTGVVTNNYAGEKVAVNYIEGKAGVPGVDFTLEDPLTFVDGRKVRTAADWAARRAEILQIFAKEMYGAEPPKPDVLITDLLDEKTTCDGYALRRRYAMFFKPDRSGPRIEWTVWIPRHLRGAPAPVISLLNYRGAHEFVADADLSPSPSWSRRGKFVKDGRAVADTRGVQLDQNHPGSIFPLQMILARGYAVMTACYCDVSPDPDWFDKPPYDQKTFAYTGVFMLWGARDESRTDNITAIGAWAWALSRGLDLAERIPELDAKRSVVTGCSRLGKAALLAGARDTRFAVCVPNQCGGGGACIAKRNYGESIATEIRSFSHWYCRAYDKYEKDPAKLLPFDQHLLVAAVAPRALLIEGMTDSAWMDTKAEYLACRAAAPVWAFLGYGTMPDVAYPDDYGEEGIGRRFGYVRRPGAHGISGYDWNWLLNFADRNLCH